MNANWGAGWGNVDSTGQSASYAAFLDLHHHRPDTQAYKRRVYAGLGLAPGQRVLDAGCGIGLDCEALAPLVAPGGRVVGVDSSEALVTRAYTRLSGSGLPVEFQVADLSSLPFAPASFDVVLCDRVLQHVASPQQVVNGLARALAPGGRLCLVDTDWGTALHAECDPAHYEKYRRYYLERSGLRNPRVGRSLWGMARRAGLTPVGVEGFIWADVHWSNADAFRATVRDAVSLQYMTQFEAQELVCQLEQSSSDGTFFHSVTGTIVWADRTA